ncbi:Nn.00g115300.m01.CDS01 [Neocucurbitaria sp. VM-36]
MASQRSNQWWIPGEGISRAVIAADIQRYLGPDALVRPGIGTGENEGQPGYWITAYRTLTTQMIQDLKMDSQRWEQEKGRGQTEGNKPSRSYAPGKSSVSDSDLVGKFEYDSRIHQARQHWGPTQAYNSPVELSRPYSGVSPFTGLPPSDAYEDPYQNRTADPYGRYQPYAAQVPQYASPPASSSYTTTGSAIATSHPSSGASRYPSSYQPGYYPSPYESTYPPSAYSGYGQSSFTNPSSTSSRYSQSSYSQPPSTSSRYGQSPYGQPQYGQSSYGRPSQSGVAHGYASSPNIAESQMLRTFNAPVIAAAPPGSYIASDGRQYPLSQQSGRLAIPQTAVNTRARSDDEGKGGMGLAPLDTEEPEAVVQQEEEEQEEELQLAV